MSEAASIVGPAAPGSRTRRPLKRVVAGLVLAIGAIVVLARPWSSGWQEVVGNPLDAGVATETGIPVTAGDRWTFGNLFLTNYGSSPVVLDTVVPVEGSEGLVVEEVSWHPVEGSPHATADVFPPEPGYELHPIVGKEILPGEIIQIVAAVELAEGSTTGEVPGWTVRYRVDGKRFETTLAHSLLAGPPPSG